MRINVGRKLACASAPRHAHMMGSKQEQCPQAQREGDCRSPGPLSSVQLRCTETPELWARGARCRWVLPEPSAGMALLADQTLLPPFCPRLPAVGVFLWGRGAGGQWQNQSHGASQSARCAFEEKVKYGRSHVNRKATKVHPELF